MPTLLIIFACISFLLLICTYMLKVYLLSACCLLAFVISIIFLSTHKDNNNDDNKNNYNWTDAQKTELDNRIYDTKTGTWKDEVCYGIGPFKSCKAKDT